MGGIQSTLSADQVVAGTAVAAVIGYALYNNAKPETPPKAASTSGDKKQRKRKGGKRDDGEGSGTRNPPSLAASAALFDDNKLKDSVASVKASSNTLQVPKPKKAKRKAAGSNKGGSSQSASAEEGTPEPPQTQRKSSKMAESSMSFMANSPSASMMDASWTRVGKGRSSKRSNAAAAAATGSEAGTSAAEASSDAGITTTSATGDEEAEEDQRQTLTLAERLVAKPPKTEVDDMLPADPGLARVMRISGDQPVQETPGGISWKDYEDADEMQHSTDADAEDDEGWGIVQGRKRTPRPEVAPTSSTSDLPSTITDADLAKRQRQREAKREARKDAKVDGEAQRLATLAKYKREQEEERMKAQQAKKGGGKKVLSGGMQASVKDGNLVWE